jgi:hypothetical protein
MDFEETGCEALERFLFVEDRVNRLPSYVKAGNQLNTSSTIILLSCNQ